VELPVGEEEEEQMSDLASMILPPASVFSTPRDVKPGESFTSTT